MRGMTQISTVGSVAGVDSPRLMFDAVELAELAGALSDPAPRLHGVPRVKRPVRNQHEYRDTCLEELVPADHPVRAVWAFVIAQDLSAVYDQIAAVEGEPGRDAIDPRILMTLWLFATIEGIGSAREIVRLTHRDILFQWICGGVSVNHTRLSAFRTGSTDLLDEVLTNSVAVLMQQDLVTLQRVAQDGVRVRASAGKSSFRRERTLQELHAEAQQHLAELKPAADEQPAAASARQKAARARAAKEREERIAQALDALPTLAATREKRHAGDGLKTRVSTTDAEARTMKMANGGFNPAYNVQFATDTGSGIIVGVDVNNEGSDAGLMQPMVEQIEDRFEKVPDELLTDGGYSTVDDITAVSAAQVVVYTPIKEEERKRAKGIDPFAPLPSDSPEVAAWRQRMGQPETKLIYRDRASTAEWVNAQARNRGLQQFRVRGLLKVKAVAMWYAIVHNVLRALKLCATPASATM
jgi:transposase